MVKDLSSISTMATRDLDDDKTTILRAFEAFSELGRDGGVGEECVWLIVGESTAKAKRNCTNDLSILEMIGTDNGKMASIFGGKLEESIPIRQWHGQWRAYLAAQRLCSCDCWIMDLYLWIATLQRMVF